MRWDDEVTYPSILSYMFCLPAAGLSSDLVFIGTVTQVQHKKAAPMMRRVFSKGEESMSSAVIRAYTQNSVFLKIISVSNTMI